MRVVALCVAVFCLLSASTPTLASARADKIVVKVPLPRGARRLDVNYYRIPKRFADAAAMLRRIVRRKGWSVKVLPVEKFGKIIYLRILSRDAFAPFSALHLVLAEGRTTLYIVPPVTQ